MQPEQLWYHHRLPFINESQKTCDLVDLQGRLTVFALARAHTRARCFKITDCNAYRYVYEHGAAQSTGTVTSNRVRSLSHWCKCVRIIPVLINASYYSSTCDYYCCNTYCTYVLTGLPGTLTFGQRPTAHPSTFSAAVEQTYKGSLLVLQSPFGDKSVKF